MSESIAEPLCPHSLNGTHRLSEPSTDHGRRQDATRCDWCTALSESVGSQSNACFAKTDDDELWQCMFIGCGRVACGGNSYDHWARHRTKTNDVHCIARCMLTGRLWCSECDRWLITEPLQAPAVFKSSDNNNSMEEASEPDSDSDMECDDFESKGNEGLAGVSDALPCGFDILRAAELCGKGDVGARGRGDECLLSDDESESDDDSNDRVSPSGLTGLRNLGNTCYLNATLQALVHLPPFFVHFIECATLLPPNARLANSLAQLLRKLWSLRRRSWLEPSGVLLALCGSHRQFVGIAQHDSQELLRCLLDTLHEELRKPVVATTTTTAAADDAQTPAVDSRASSPVSNDDDNDDDDDDARYDTADSGVSERSSLSPSTKSTGASSGVTTHTESTATSLARYNTDTAVAAAARMCASASICNSQVNNTFDADNNDNGDDVEMVVPCGHGQGDADDCEMSVALSSELNSQKHSDEHQQQQQQQGQQSINYESIVSRVFDGTLVSSAECLSCHRVSTTRETFQDLSLPIPSHPSSVGSSTSRGAVSDGVSRGGGSEEVSAGWLEWIWGWTVGWWLPVVWAVGSVSGPTVSLYDCLDSFFSTDELKDDNMYSCERCGKLRRGLRYCRIVRLPEVLTVHLKRFRHELHSSTKLSTRVTFPLRSLQMSAYTGSPSVTADYHLAAVVCHSGSASGGHYTALVRNADSGCWYEFDDMCVTRIRPEVVAACQPYVLFYRMKNSTAVPCRERAVRVALSCPAASSPRTYFLSRAWLSCFNTLVEPGPIDNTAFACEHGARRPGVTSALARAACVRVSAALWYFLHSRKGGGPAAVTLHGCRVCARAQRSLCRRRRRELAEFKRHVRQNGPGAGDMAGSCCYAVAGHWLRHWQAFVHEEGASQPPGHIDNTTIIDTSRQGDVQLKKGCDYAAIDGDLWRYLVSIYGGGPVVPLFNQTAKMANLNHSCNSSVSDGRSSDSTSHITNGISTPCVTSGVSTLHVTDALPTSHVTDGLSTSHFTDTLSTSHVTDALPTSHVTGALPTSHVTGSLSTSHVTGSLYTPHVADALSTSHVNDALPTSHVTDALSTSHVTNALPTSHFTDVSISHVTNDDVTSGVASLKSSEMECSYMDSPMSDVSHNIDREVVGSDNVACDVVTSATS